MSEKIDFSEQLPELTETFPFPETNEMAWEAFFDHKSEYEEQLRHLPWNAINFFVTVYPEKLIEGDFAFVEKLAEVDTVLRARSHQPVLLVNQHQELTSGKEFRAISFGFSLGEDIDQHVDLGSVYGSVPMGSVRPVLFGPQTLLYYDDTGILFSQSFGVRAMEPSPVGHIGGFLTDRSVHWVPRDGESWVYTVQDAWGELMVGNELIEEYVVEHPDLALVIDGCREAYRNGGTNPEIGRSIARTFGLDKTLSDGEQTKLQWF